MAAVAARVKEAEKALISRDSPIFSGYFGCWSGRLIFFSASLAKKLKIECAKYSSEEKKIIYARLGGEEFAILIFHENEETKTPDLIRANINGSTEKVS